MSHAPPLLPGGMLVVPIIHMIGMSMGLTVWGVSYMISGWVVGR